MSHERILKQHAADRGVVRITCRDGRVIAARIIHVDKEFRDVICRYADSDSKAPQLSPIGLLPFCEISGIEEAGEPCGPAS